LNSQRSWQQLGYGVARIPADAAVQSLQPIYALEGPCRCAHIGVSSGVDQEDWPHQLHHKTTL
jgi:hypothetical protein